MQLSSLLLRGGFYDNALTLVQYVLQMAALGEVLGIRFRNGL